MRTPVVRIVPAAVVGAIVVAALALIATAHWRRGAFALAAAAAVTALIRLAMPAASRPALLAVRGKAFDVVFAAALAALMTVVAIGV